MKVEKEQISLTYRHPIRILPSSVIYKIAAGEVIDRPCSIVKELIENSLDAGATFIQIDIRGGGKSLIAVQDNGHGMSSEDLHLAVHHHTTSKLYKDELSDIQTLGFRGEALPSIAQVSRLNIFSKANSEQTGWHISYEGGEYKDIKPISYLYKGTRVEVKDLFYETPTRLKFLKTSTWECDFIINMFKRLSLSAPGVRLCLNIEKRKTLDFSICPFEERIFNVLGEDFKNNSIPIDTQESYVKIKGAISLPTFTKSTPNFQYFFVNGRPVRDRFLSIAIQIAYQDLLFRKSHPLIVLFLEIPSDYIDVNVHPQKHEVRFQDSDFIKDVVRDTVRENLKKFSYQVSTTLSKDLIQLISSSKDNILPPHSLKSLRKDFRQGNNETRLEDTEEDTFKNCLLGHARGQFYKTFIFSEGEEEIFIIDQHAIHERLVYEGMKESVKERGLKIRVLNPPLKFSCADLQRADLLVRYQEELKVFGLIIKKEEESILVLGIPEILENINVKNLLDDLTQEIREFGEPLQLQERIEQICSVLSCHLSIRGGQYLSVEKMNDLLRQVEKINYFAQCNHGRPTYVSLKKKDLERLFKRI